MYETNFVFPGRDRLMVLLIVLSTQSNTTEDPATEIAATILPIYNIAQNVAGDVLEVELILPPGASPHTFEVTPSSIRNLKSTKVVYAVGHGLDDWTNQISESAGTDICPTQSRSSEKDHAARRC